MADTILKRLALGLIIAAGTYCMGSALQSESYSLREAAYEPGDEGAVYNRNGQRIIRDLDEMTPADPDSPRGRALIAHAKRVRLEYRLVFFGGYAWAAWQIVGSLRMYLLARKGKERISV